MPTIMIIDDDAALRLALSIRLKSAGFNVLTVEHPDTAVNSVLRRLPDLILLDIEMARFNGFEFHDCIRLTERGRNIPVAYLSGVASLKNRQEASNRGARAFLAKPYDPQSLTAAVRGMLAIDGSELSSLS